VADRPLRPATDRSLGRPLPHQQANRTQAAPKAPEGFPPKGTCGISPSFPGLFPTSGHVPTRYSPVRRWGPKPPARLACVRHAASVRSEPGSNSQVHPRHDLGHAAHLPRVRPRTLSILPFSTPDPPTRTPGRSRQASHRTRRDLHRTGGADRASHPFRDDGHPSDGEAPRHPTGTEDDRQRVRRATRRPVRRSHGPRRHPPLREAGQAQAMNTCRLLAVDHAAASNGITRTGPPPARHLHARPSRSPFRTPPPQSALPRPDASVNEQTTPGRRSALASRTDP
jgi:hypothetical protein